jgi:hypothetical protein
MKDFFKYASKTEIALVVVMTIVSLAIGIPMLIRDFGDVWDWWTK